MKDLEKFTKALKFTGKVSLDVAELVLLTRSADNEQRKTAVSYMDAYKEQNGEIKTPEQWTQFYTGVKKRLTV